MKNKWPNKVYIQIEDQCGNKATPETMLEQECTWSDTRINKSDIVYIRHKNVGNKHTVGKQNHKGHVKPLYNLGHCKSLYHYD